MPKSAAAAVSANGHLHSGARFPSITGLRVAATGSYVPDGVVTNDQLGQYYKCDPEWIIRRTGIIERRHSLPHQATSDLCYEAGRQCLERAEVDRSQIDFLLVATYTPDTSFPNVACVLQHRLGLTCPAMDLNVACAGFIYALVTGAMFIKSGNCRKVLIIGGDTNSRIADPSDPKTYPLFGDAAGAVLLEKCDDDATGLVRYVLGSDGSGADLLIRPGCGSRLPPEQELLRLGLHFLKMDGRGVFRWAVNILCDTIRDVLNDAGVSLDQVDRIITHQANIRIIHAATDVLGIPRDKVASNVKKYGNTSAASVPLALDEAVSEGQVRRGGYVVLSGFGAGLAWGTALMRW